MKVVRKDTVPVVLIIMGLVMVTVSSMEWMARNEDLLFVAGGAIALLGFLLWAVPALDRYLKKQARKRDKVQRMAARSEEAPRSYPRTRR
jgi:hypothetical protein